MAEVGPALSLAQKQSTSLVGGDRLRDHLGTDLMGVIADSRGPRRVPPSSGGAQRGKLLLLRKHLPGVGIEEFNAEFSRLACQVLKLLGAMLFLIFLNSLSHVLFAIFEQAVDEFGQVVCHRGNCLLGSEAGMQHSEAGTVWTLAIAQRLRCDPQGYGCAGRDFSCCAFLDASPGYFVIWA